jgi:hypothetical protein
MAVPASTKTEKAKKKRNKHKSEVPHVVSELTLEFSGSSVPVFCSYQIFIFDNIVAVSGHQNSMRWFILFDFGWLYYLLKMN